MHFLDLNSSTVWACIVGHPLEIQYDGLRISLDFIKKAHYVLKLQIFQFKSLHYKVTG